MKHDQMRAWLKERAMTFIFRRPSLFRFFYGSRAKYAHLVVSRDTELVIEGYPRCANSFAVLAFERAQGHPMKLAHHLHAQAQIMLAVKYGVPILILIRDPISAAASLITRHPELSATYALRQYVDFYDCIRSHLEDVVVAKFTTVTQDYARVVRTLNCRYGKKYQLYQNSDAEDAAVFREIDRLNHDNESGQTNQLARPSEAKRTDLAKAREVVERHLLAPQALDVFRAIEQVCV